ncbi:unnamed protein product [Miscanthus lutarioriparius]|uniref:Uncharacterized protein n=1 Tax=Miscanthus lutarioriparius TaxID=422564 RepID=A0A811QAB8_9POAL|nr:unnamed protein product [Miscanthus lutarioriparius]
MASAAARSGLRSLVMRRQVGEDHLRRDRDLHPSGGVQPLQGPPTLRGDAGRQGHYDYVKPVMLIGPGECTSANGEDVSFPPAVTKRQREETFLPIEKVPTVYANRSLFLIDLLYSHDRCQRFMLIEKVVASTTSLIAWFVSWLIYLLLDQRTETTALGAAYAAGLAAGIWTKEQVFAGLHTENMTFFRPKLDEARRKKRADSWFKAVSRSFDLADIGYWLITCHSSKHMMPNM